MPEILMNIKPLSVNECWQGKRFKTQAYITYEKELLWTLPKIKLPDPPYRMCFVFGFSNMCADFDNPIKPLVDILQKKYGFNDKDIHLAEILKVKVPKGHEYFKVNIYSLKN